MTQTRWDFSKSRSSYHFDPTIVEDSDPPFKIVGRVQGDLVYHLQEALKANPVERVQESTISSE
jgi:2-polyprenyl-6-methoxyphenol hydroxylase-like FAD-dependent oxidoreductase